MEEQDLAAHISHAFNEDLQRVRAMTLQMGRMVETQLGDAVTALVSGDTGLARRVEYDDYRVNHLEVTIDNECSGLIVRRQPTASDLRFVMSVIKITADLERIGDEAEKVASYAAHLAEMDRPRDNYRPVAELGGDVRDMVRDAINAFEHYNVRLARDVLKRDDYVDKQYDKINSECMSAMTRDPRHIRRSLYLLWITRALERIGDHAKNVSEQVFYFVEGLDVRHLGQAAAPDNAPG